MSGRIQVNYGEVFGQVAQCRSTINQGLSTLNGEYNRLATSLRGLDSATNAAFISAANRNRMKAAATAQIMEKLLTFISESARQVQAQEQAIASRLGNMPRTR